MKNLKIYGSGVKPLDLVLNNRDAYRLKVGVIIKIDNSFFEIISKIQKRDELYFNVCFFPNPHLYDKLDCLNLSKDSQENWTLGKIREATAA